MDRKIVTTIIETITIFLVLGMIMAWNDIEKWANFATIFGTVLAAILAIIGINTYIENMRWNSYRYLADVYNDILKTELNNPDFKNPEITQNYDCTWSSSSTMFFKYDTYALICWSYLEDIYYAKQFREDFLTIYAPLFKMYKDLHGKWFESNKKLFMPDFVEFIAKRNILNL